MEQILSNRQVTAPDIKVTAKSQNKPEEVVTAERQVSDKIEAQELADERLTQLVWINGSHVDKKTEIESDHTHGHEEMDVLPLSVDDHLTINQRTIENVHCTTNMFEHSKPKVNQNQFYQ